MENQLIQTYHERLCHLGLEKCFEQINRTYWFPEMKRKIKEFTGKCLKCLYFAPNSGKVEGVLHNIPKGTLPFETLHVDHLGPFASSRTKKRHIFVAIDGFTKFVKLFAVNSTDTKEVVTCLQFYFNTYSRPKTLISDRGTCFTSESFEKFLTDNNVKHVKIATLSPQSNGQVERVNRVLIPMLGKECDGDSTIDWYKHLTKVEFAINNTVNRVTGFTPSKLLFGVNQRGKFCDGVAEYLKENVLKEQAIDVVEMRDQASENIKKGQDYNKTQYDRSHKRPKLYKKGDYILIKNNITIPGVNKKLFAKYRGPYEVENVLPHDRYLIKDLDGMQLTRIPYRGVCSPANMRPFLTYTSTNEHEDHT